MAQTSGKALTMNNNLKRYSCRSFNLGCADSQPAHQKNPTPWNVAPDKNHYPVVKKLIRWSKMERIDHRSATQCHGI